MWVMLRTTSITKPLHKRLPKGLELASRHDSFSSLHSPAKPVTFCFSSGGLLRFRN